MNCPQKAQHDLKSDIHNVLTLLKFIQEDEELQDPTLKTMLEKCLEREGRINQNLETLKETIKDSE